MFGEVLSMSTAKRFLLAATGVALLALVLAASPANAQIRRGFTVPGVGGTLNPGNYYDPYGFSRQAAFNIALYGRAMSQVPPYALGYNPYVPNIMTPMPWYGGGGYGTIMNNSLATYPGYGTSPGYSPGYGGGGGYGGYGGYGYGGPNGYGDWGFLQGASSVINADGQFRIANQQANLLRENVRSAHIENRRKAFDEFLYERANTPTWLDDLEHQRKLNLRYALTNATGSEILSGTPLNILLDNIKQMQSKGVKGPDIGVSPDTLEKINVSAGSGVNPALLKSERMTWPLALTRSEFSEDRKNIERNLAAAVREAEVGPVEPKRLQDLRDEVDKLSDQLSQQIGDMTPTQYIDAKNYLQLLGAGVRLLERPDGGNYVNGKYAAKGKNVGDLVRNMTGLQFAPATPGTEQAYKDLYEKLVAFYNQAQPSSRGE
jgi:hypothetical protein